MMQQAVKYIIGGVYKPLLVKYLAKTRTYQYKGINLTIPPEVFHPGFFPSTKLLFLYIEKLSLDQKTFLELGAGSGLISIRAARKGAIVTSTDINPVAIQSIKKNADENQVTIRILQSDLFKDIPVQSFDFIAINPPYYKKQPNSYAEYAWYCGENGEYFQRLFYSLKDYVHPNSMVLMILCDGCDLGMIHRLANGYGLRLNCVHLKHSILERNFIYKIELAE